MREMKKHYKAIVTLLTVAVLGGVTYFVVNNPNVLGVGIPSRYAYGRYGTPNQIYPGGVYSQTGNAGCSACG